MPVRTKTSTGDSDTELKLGNATVTLSNLQKIYWPKDGYLKKDLIEYYVKIADYILPYLKNRPMSLFRNPNGIGGLGFYQKDIAGKAPAYAETKLIFSESTNKDVEYMLCNNKATLAYLANLGCIEMNPWNSRVESMDTPDYMIIDIDPSDGNTFDQVIETAKVVNAVLQKAKADSCCKTSGATGIHVYVPMGRKYNYDQVRAFGQVVATLVQEALPDFTSLERSLKKRGRKNIYIDYLQNSRGQTLASVYSLRPKPGAPVSTPLEWKELKPGIYPAQFNIKSIFKRLEKKGDLFKPVLGKGIDLKKSLKLLGA